MAEKGEVAAGWLTDAQVSEVSEAIATIKAFLRKEYIVDECRNAPCLGCVSCDAVDLERKLDALLGLI